MMCGSLRTLVLAGLLLGSTTAVAGEIKPGETLDQTTWEKAKDLLPEEVLRHYKDGGYVNKVLAWPQEQYTFPPDFKAGSDANAGKFDVSAQGTIIDKATGKQPPFLIGHPFPTIDPSDKDAGVKVLWNHFYRTWYFGNLMAESRIDWVAPSGLERHADVIVRWAYYDGVPPDERPAENPENYLVRNLSLVVGPADLNGTAALTWRYRDGDRRDSTWAYVPALRRVRQTSPANRSDGFLGSDESQDDGPFFDGKAEDFDWKLAGEVDQLRFCEETNLKGEGKAKWIDGKGWDTDWPDIPYIGYQDKSWKGLPWAPTGAAALCKRRAWIVEGVPRDKYYLYGKLQLYIDKTSYQGSWNRKFGWKGELLAIHQVMAWNPLPFKRPTGKIDYNQGGNQAYQTIENIKLNRATVAGIKSSPKAGFYTRINLDPAIFDVDALARSGK